MFPAQRFIPLLARPLAASRVAAFLPPSGSAFPSSTLAFAAQRRTLAQMTPPPPQAESSSEPLTQPSTPKTTSKPSPDNFVAEHYTDPYSGPTDLPSRSPSLGYGQYRPTDLYTKGPNVADIAVNWLLVTE